MIAVPDSPAVYEQGAERVGRYRPTVACRKRQLSGSESRATIRYSGGFIFRRKAL
jgi:hypothetical protein